MSVRQSSDSCTKAAVSVTEMARRFDLSRSRFYDLIRDGTVPQPVYCTRTRRPMYINDLIEQCLRVRRTNTGIDGRYVVFYDRRLSDGQQTVERRPRRSRASSSSPVAGGQMVALVESLRALGVEASETQITTAVRACYPTGFEDLDAAVAAVFRHLRRANGA